MNLYKISQTINIDCDTFDSAIVCAESVDSAKKMPVGDPKRNEWCEPEHVHVELIGSAYYAIRRGVVLASFNDC